MRWPYDEEKLCEAYQKLKPYLWCAVSRVTGKAYPRCYGGPYPPFAWSAARPVPTVAACDGPLYRAPARDFPNPDLEWGHPSLEAFLRAWKYYFSTHEYS